MHSTVYADITHSTKSKPVKTGLKPRLLVYFIFHIVGNDRTTNKMMVLFSRAS